MARDLRSHIAANAGLVLRVPKPVRREHLSALIVQARRPVLFERIEECPGWQVCDLLFRDRAAQAGVLGTTPDKVTEVLGARLTLPPLPTRTVSPPAHFGAVREAGAFDLRDLPIFRHGARDPLPALIVMNVCRAPDGGPANFSFTRMTPFEAGRATMLIGSSPHQRAILAQWEARGEPMPMACVIGTHPAYEIMASYSVPEHLGEFGELDLVGNLLGETVELMDCRTVPLQVPAHAELVIEGHVLPRVRRDDGPGPSQALYYLPGVTRQPVFEATLMMARAEPILRQHDTLTYSDHQPLISLPHEALMLTRLRSAGHDVLDVFYVPWGGTLACVVQMVPQTGGEARELLASVLDVRWPNCRLAIAVDADVDIGSPEDLVWSLATRVDPERDLMMLSGAKGHPIDPTARQKGSDPRDVVTNKWAIDATRPPVADPAGRARFERTEPPGRGAVSLEDYL